MDVVHLLGGDAAGHHHPGRAAENGTELGLRRLIVGIAFAWWLTEEMVGS